MARLTIDTYEMQVNYGGGYEDELTEYSLYAKKDRSREYRENCPQYATRWKRIRVNIRSLEPGELERINKQIKSDEVYYDEEKAKRDTKKREAKELYEALKTD